MSLTATEVHALKIAPPVEGVLPAIRERWSAVVYRAGSEPGDAQKSV